MAAVVGCCAVAQICAGQSDWYSRGKVALDGKRYEEAAVSFAEAEKHSPGATDALALRAKALIQLHQYEAAQQSLDSYLKAHPNSADATYLLGYVLFRRNLPTESLAMYTAAARTQPPQADDFKIVGLDYVLLHDYPEAIKWLERSVAEGPRDAEAVYYLGRAYYVQNQFDKAIAAFRRALALDPQFARAENNLGLAFAGKNQSGEAEAAYRKAIAMQNAGSAKSDQPYLNLAEMLSHTDRHAEALSLLDTAEQIGGKSERAEGLRGQILLSQDRLHDAEIAFRTAVQLKPSDGALHFLLGRVLKREGLSDAAEQEFAQSRTLAKADSPLRP